MGSWLTSWISNKVGELEGETLRREIRLVVEHLCDTEDTLLKP